MIRVNKEKLTTAMLVLLTTWLIVLILVLASVPPVSRDALIHHLAVPKLWIEQGGIYEMPNLIASYYPMNLDLLYVIPLYFGNDIVPKYIHFAFALATAGLIYTYLSKRLGRSYALTGSLLFLTTPVIIKLSITAYVDLGLVFFTTLSLFQLLAWAENGFRFRHLAWAAVACGLAAGSKYNGLISLFILTAMTPYIYLRRYRAKPAAKKELSVQGKALGCGLVFAAIAGLVFMPWMARNAIWTGNPLHPLFSRTIQTLHGPGDGNRTPVGETETHHAAERPQVEARSAETANHFVVRKLVYEESWWETATIPLRIFFQGRDDDPKYFDGKLNPFLLLLPLLLFMGGIKGKGANHSAGSRQNKDWMLLGVFSLLFLFFVFVYTDMRIRYIAPIIPFLTVLSMAGLKQLMTWAAQRKSLHAGLMANGCALAMALSMFGVNTVYLVDQFKRVAPCTYMSGRVSRDAYIEKFRPEYAAIKHANAHLPDQAEILALFIGGRGYYSDRSMRYDKGFLKSAVERADTAQDMRANLAAFGFTHLLIRFDMFDNWCHNFMDKKEKQIVIEFIQDRGLLLFAKNGHGLYKL